MTRETVMAETPAWRATSWIVMLPRLRRLGLFILHSPPAPATNRVDPLEAPTIVVALT